MNESTGCCYFYHFGSSLAFIVCLCYSKFAARRQFPYISNQYSGSSPGIRKFKMKSSSVHWKFNIDRQYSVNEDFLYNIENSVDILSKVYYDYN